VCQEFDGASREGLESMANIQSQFGFKHIGFLPGFAPDYAQIPRAIQSTYGTTIGFGDPVQKINATSNYIGQGVASSFGTASATGILEGIFVGCRFPSTTLGEDRAPAWTGAKSGDGVGYVISSPGALFLVAALNTAIVTANIGQTVNFTTGTSSIVGGMFSIATIDQATATSSASTSSPLPFKIVKLFDGIGNGSDPLTPFNWVVVTFNNQVYKSLAGL
jgi:hypothetical protein